MKNACQLSFAQLSLEQHGLVRRWLRTAHVAEWIHGTGLQHILDRLELLEEGILSPTQIYIASCDGQPFACLISAAFEEGYKEAPYAAWLAPGQKAYSLDLFIGEPNFIGRGLSTRMIQEFIQRELSDANIILIDPESTNSRAIHVYERAGFEPVDRFIASWHPVPHTLMRMQRTALRTFAAPQVVETERLVLRPWKEGDLRPFAALNADPQVMEHFPAQLSPSQSDQIAGRFRQEIEKKGWGFWAVSCPGVSDFIGMIGIEYVRFGAPFTPAVEIGWRLARGHWGSGYATEGAMAARDFAFQRLGLSELVAFTIPANLRSQAVMKKIGMAPDLNGAFEHPRLAEGHPMRPHLLYRMSR